MPYAPKTAAPRRLLAVLLLLVSLAAPAAARADYQELLRDACRDEKVDGTYSQKDYRQALQNIPADALQYTNCHDVLRAAQLAAAGAQGSGRRTPAGGDTTGGGSASAAEKTAAAAAIRSGGGAVQIDGTVIEPSTFGAGRTVAASISDLPASLLVALALIVVGAVGALALLLLPRVRDRQRS